MRWLKRERWKASIALAGLLLLLILMVCIPVLVAGAYEGASGPATPGTATLQATPTEDTTMTALNKEKLVWDINKDKSGIDKDRSDIFWSWTSALTVFTVIGGIITAFITAMRYFNDRSAEREEREKEVRETFRTAVEGLGSENYNTRRHAVTSLHAFLVSGYERYYRQVFDLAVAYLRLGQANQNAPEPFSSLNQALASLFNEAFPRARDLLKNRGGRSAD